MINKDVHKSLARKKGNYIPIWSWNDSRVTNSELIPYKFRITYETLTNDFVSEYRNLVYYNI